MSHSVNSTGSEDLEIWLKSIHLEDAIPSFKQHNVSMSDLLEAAADPDTFRQNVESLDLPQSSINRLWTKLYEEQTKRSFDFDSWIDQHGLKAVKPAFIQNGMTTVDTIHMNDHKFTSLMNHPLLLQHSRLLYNIVRAIKSLELESTKPPPLYSANSGMTDDPCYDNEDEQDDAPDIDWDQQYESDNKMASDLYNFARNDSTRHIVKEDIVQRQTSKYEQLFNGLKDGVKCGAGNTWWIDKRTHTDKKYGAFRLQEHTSKNSKFLQSVRATAPWSNHSDKYRIIYTEKIYGKKDKKQTEWRDVYHGNDYMRISERFIEYVEMLQWKNSFK